MNPNLTHITSIIDRSGSMQDVKTDAEGAINHFFDEQKLVAGDCSVLLVDFDSHERFRVAFDGKLADITTYELMPRGLTPLLDAIGKGISVTGERLSALPEADRPSKVIFIIQTDGQENDSKSYSWEQVRDLIKIQTDTYSWQFVFLGMGLDTFKQGNALGISNVVSTAANNAATYDSTQSVLSASTRSYRTGAAKSMSAMSGMHVNSAGRVFNQAGDEIDPATGEPIKVKA